MTRGATILILGLVAGMAHGQAAPPALTKVAEVSSKDKTIRTETVVCKCMPYTVTKEVEVNGRKEQVTVMETRMVCETMQSPPRSLKEAKAYDGGGTKLSEAQLWQRLKAGEVIVMATDSIPEADYMKLFRKEALILVVPQSAMMDATPVATPAVPIAVPAVPGVAPPRIPRAPALPPVPNVPALPAVPAVPALPPIPSVPALPPVPAVPPVPAPPGVPPLPPPPAPVP